MPNLPCADGGGSLYNPANANTINQPYVAPDLCVGTWTLTNQDPDNCELNDQRRMESYVAEVININGAPINVFKLLGIHSQGNGSLLSQGKLISSQSAPGFPLSDINTGIWKSFHNGANVTNSAFIGVDFGLKKDKLSGSNANAPGTPNFIKVGAVKIKQSNDPFEYASQIKVEYSDGSITSNYIYNGVGDGIIKNIEVGSNLITGTFIFSAVSSTEFTVSALIDNNIISLPNLITNKLYLNNYLTLQINQGIIPFSTGDIFTINLVNDWKRIGLFNLRQSDNEFVFKFQSQLFIKSLRITPTIFNGTNQWGIREFDVLESAPADINDIQDLFFNENRDRDYSKTPILIKAQYSPVDSNSDLSRFGISILDQYQFTSSFAAVVKQLGRPFVIGDIIEVIPELQYDQNLKPIRKFLEVTDTAWASEGFSPHWKPTVLKFSAQPAIPSQETRDIFGTPDTQKYLLADQVLAQNPQLDTTPLTQLEEILKGAANDVPETGDSALREIAGVHKDLKAVKVKGQPVMQQISNEKLAYVEDGLPKNGEAYMEGFTLPDVIGLADGVYFRLNYPPHINIASRLYRFSLVKNRWIYLETDRRGEYSSHKPTAKSFINNKININDKL